MFTRPVPFAPGEISAFVIYMGQILQSLLKITNVFNNFVRTSASSRRISEVLSSQSDFGTGLPGTANLPEQTFTAASLGFSSVTFAYPQGSGKPALHDISFSVPQGGSLAVIGPTGSGKSTLAWLLIRLYDPDSGTITINGQDIKNLDVHMLRRSIALVPQESMLFSGTALSNLTWGNTSADDDTVTESVHTAGADFITEKNGGFEMQLGSGGVNLSGGQKQRLSIARALIKGGSILVLDDATSALDAITESHVRSAILAQKNRMTVIFITQRCSTAMAADRILVLENGECCGYGTHRELMQNCSIYRDIYDSQLGGIQHAAV
jgi:ATP-binding cassette subfamily B multidrug efflux pump